MLKKVIVLGSAAVLLVGVRSTLYGQEVGERAGKKVMIVRDGVQLRVGSRVVGSVPLGTIVDVSRSNAKWLWIEARQGWVQLDEVAPYDKAIAHFTTAIEQNPTSQAYHRRGIAHAAMGEFEKAMADFSAAIKREARNTAAYNDRGNAQRKLGKLDEAMADFSELIRRGVRHPAVYTNRGLVRQDKGQYDEAITDYNSAIAIDPSFAPAWEAGGLAREAKGDVAKAISNYERAIKLDAKFARAHNNLAWILATSPDNQFRNGKKAVQHAKEACDLTGSQDAGYLDTFAAALAESGRFEQAIKLAKEAVDKATDQHKPAIEARLKMYREQKPFRSPKSGV